MDRDKIVPILPNLLVWIQDMNWPVAPGILELLLTFPEEIVPYEQEVLSFDDDQWKWFSLKYLVPELPLESRVQFREYLTRVAQTPTPTELAKEILRTLSVHRSDKKTLGLTSGILV